MRIHSAILGTFIFVASLLAFADTCKVVSVSAGHNTDRIRLVRFTDGRGIWIVGHNHGLRDIPFELMRILRLSQDQADNANFTRQLDNLAARATTATREAIVDLEALRALISANPEIGFMGFESTQETWEGNLPNYARLQIRFDETLLRRGLTATTAQSQLPLVAMGPLSYLKINNPETLGDREVRGFESANVIKETELAAATAEKALADLRKLAAGDKKFLGNISGTDTQLWSVYTKLGSSVSEDSLRDLMKKAPIPAAYREATMIWFNARLVEMAGYKARELAVVENTLATGKSGVVVMGKKHLDSIADAFAKACR